MKKYLISSLCGGLLISLSMLAQAEDKPMTGTEAQTTNSAKNSVKKGDELHQAHCQACHHNMTEGNPSQLYTRKDRNVNTRSGLDNQVQRCVTNLKLDWFDDEIENVSIYLNSQYYHF